MNEIDFDMAHVVPTLLNVLLVSIMAIVGLNFLKWFFTRWPVSGLTELVLGA